MSIKANASIERNRKGDRLVDCIDILHCNEDAPSEFSSNQNNNDRHNDYYFGTTTTNTTTTATTDDTTTIDDSITTATDDPTQINIKAERHNIFAHWLVN